MTPPLRGSRQAKGASPKARRWGEVKRSYSSQTLERARSLRQTQTATEGLLWHFLRNRQLGGYKFRRQQPIGPYITDVASLDVLQLSCGGDASQAFSFVNMGANVTACDFSPVAIEEAKQNAARVGLAVRFVVDDAQRLSTIGDGASDLVHADGNLWYYEDLPTACRNWYRVLRANGRLFLHENHPLTLWCLEADETDGSLRVVRSYGDTRPEYSPFQIDDFVSKESHEVEFPHTLADILNAIAQAGFVLEQMVECNLSQAGFPIEGLNQSAEKLPHNFYVIARKVP